MQEYIINVGTIEELQTIQNITELNVIFARAQRTIVRGEKVVLVRQSASGKEEKFDEITTLDDLTTYRKTVYKYLG